MARTDNPNRRLLDGERFGRGAGRREHRPVEVTEAVEPLENPHTLTPVRDARTSNWAYTAVRPQNFECIAQYSNDYRADYFPMTPSSISSKASTSPPYSAANDSASSAFENGTKSGPIAPSTSLSTT